MLSSFYFQTFYFGRRWPKSKFKNYKFKGRQSYVGNYCSCVYFNALDLCVNFYEHDILNT